MNARALSQIGEPVLIEDAMLYWELQQDNKALQQENALMRDALRKIQDCPADAKSWNARTNCIEPLFQAVARFAVQQVEGIE